MLGAGDMSRPAPEILLSAEEERDAFALDAKFEERTAHGAEGKSDSSGCQRNER
jgi:hypothetical protein